MNGYIKLWRKFREWEWYDDVNTKAVFLELLLRSNFKPNQYKGHTIQRGQCVMGIHSLAKSVNLSVQQTRTSLSHLILTNEITTKSTNRFTIVTLCKYDNYQLQDNPDQQAKQQATQQTTNKQLTTTKEEKKNKKIYIEKKKHLEDVLLLDEEFKKLSEKFGISGTEERISRLNDYKMSTGKKYASDYHTILNWARKEIPMESTKPKSRGDRKYVSKPVI